jgi:hypothetical protein
MYLEKVNRLFPVSSSSLQLTACCSLCKLSTLFRSVSSLLILSFLFISDSFLYLVSPVVPGFAICSCRRCFLARLLTRSSLSQKPTGYEPRLLLKAWKILCNSHVRHLVQTFVTGSRRFFPTAWKRTWTAFFFPTR